MLAPTKRLEIVIDVVHLQRLVSTIEAAGITSYTILPEASGRGDRGRRRGMDPANVESNSLLMAALPEEKLSGVIEAIRPLLTRYGGLCLVSDALLLQH